MDMPMPDSAVNKVSSITSSKGKRSVFGDMARHVFWAKMECGLVLSSLSPWKIEQAARRLKGGYLCRVAEVLEV